MDMTTATPTEIDTQLAALYGPEQQLITQLDALTARVAAARATLDNLAARRHQVDAARDVLDRNPEAAAKIYRRDLAANHTAQAPLHAEYERRGRWNRAFLAQTSNGHVHTTMNCPTCNNGRTATRFAWLTGYSGMTEADLLTELGASGAVLCSVCFPNAPTEWLTARPDPAVCAGSGTSRYDEATARRGFVSGNYGVCEVCGQRVTIPSGSYRLRKHKTAS